MGYEHKTEKGHESPVYMGMNDLEQCCLRESSGTEMFCTYAVQDSSHRPRVALAR